MFSPGLLSLRLYNSSGKRGFISQLSFAICKSDAPSVGLVLKLMASAEACYWHHYLTNMGENILDQKPWCSLNQKRSFSSQDYASVCNICGGALRHFYTFLHLLKLLSTATDQMHPKFVRLIISERDNEHVNSSYIVFQSKISLPCFLWTLLGHLRLGSFEQDICSLIHLTASTHIDKAWKHGHSILIRFHFLNNITPECKTLPTFQSQLHQDAAIDTLEKAKYPSSLKHSIWTFSYSFTCHQIWDQFLLW